MTKKILFIFGGVVLFALIISGSLVANYFIMAWTEPTVPPPGGTVNLESVPAAGVMAFNLAACPDGWSPYNAANGRTIIGVGGGYTLGATGGEETHALTVAEMPSHNHSGRTMGGSQGWCPNAGCGDYGGVSTMGTTGGGQAHNVMQPYIALVYCVKN